jgi:uncharacterized membrane protein
VAFTGLTDRFEGMWTLMSYLTVFFICIHYGRQKSAVKFLTYALMGSSIIMGLIGFMQYVGYDPYTAGFLRYLAFPSMAWDTVASTVKTSFEKGVVASLYNPNFMGSYGAMAVLLSLGYILNNEGTKKETIFYYIANLVSFSALVGSRSSAGLLGFAAGMIIMILFMPEAFTQNKKKFAGLAGAWVAIAIAMSLVYSSMWEGNRLIQQDYLTLTGYFIYFVAATVLYRLIFNRREKNKALLGITIVYALIVLAGAGAIYSPMNNATYTAYYGQTRQERQANRNSEKEKLKDVVITNTQIQIWEADGDYIAYEIKGNKVSALDADGNNLGLRNEGSGRYEVEAEGYEDQAIVLTKMKDTGEQLYARVPKFDLWVRIDSMGLSYKGRNHLPAEIDSPAKMGFTGNERLFTYRGYIWSRTLPLLTDHILWGAGPDCFIFEFPQYEHITKWNIGQGTYLLYDKPHNWYLQMGINTGLISLISVLAMGVLLLIQSIKRFMMDNRTSTIAATLTAVVYAYAVAGIFNDSVVHVAPVFWAIFGLAIGAVNAKEIKKKVSHKRKPEKASEKNHK